ncbi:LOW QUALITY PROTEIN: hypothetical protein MARPO_2248s0001 [Marchantia polymorpha]|uniref:Regulator of rDNA transcription protein 15 n=1 Tax=Marchantia polymorpha TaxID=3197 RepID=A0A2R6VXP7_MARPO|nr:LOW QUALITY PROTEIN: hypothetical protein MARPO_2248s0001 [Marchantia polymorpha]|eukprot:PTQ26378.1 LOW QUALITY PROTEIN: hypothetical protein MARPO_2248s0001 [Marchantia polymorpha]
MTTQPARFGSRAKLYFNTSQMCGTNIIVSSTDSGLEAFSHNPADDSFAALPDRTAANTKYLNERFLSSRSLLWVNNPTLTEFCFGMIGRADIEGSKSNVAMNAWLPQASYPCAERGSLAEHFQSALKSFHMWFNFSGTSSLKFRGTKGSIGHTFMVCIHTENQNQGDFYPFVLLEISVLHESPLGHLRYLLTDVPPQPNSPPDNVFNPDRPV